MNKIGLTLAVALIFVVGLAVFTAESRNENTSGGWTEHEFSRLAKYYVVKNHQGEYLGRMQDLVIQPDGRIVFAIISRPGYLGIRGQPVAIPFETISFGTEKNELVLDMSREQFASVPNLTNLADLENRDWAGNIYRQFGVQPPWIEGGDKSDMRR